MAETNPPVATPARGARADAEPVARLRARLPGRTGAERSRHRRGRRVARAGRSPSTRRASRRARSRRPSPGVEDRTADFDAHVASALAINPRFGAIYRIAGTHASRHYRFDDAVTLTRKGLAIDPDDARAYAELGLHLLRTGDEPGARGGAGPRLPRRPVRHRHLQPARAARYARHVRDHRRTARSPCGSTPTRPPCCASTRCRWRATRSARSARGTASRRRGPSSIEIFPRHDDFAVRNLGLPGMIGALGACFGRVVTLDSPQARPPGHVQLAGDVVARARPRDHAAAVEAARAAVADRGHLGLRGAARAARMGPPDAGAVRRGDGARRRRAARRAEPGVQRSGEDYAGVLPGVARRGAHHRGPRRGRAAARCCARTARRATPTRRIQRVARRAWPRCRSRSPPSSTAGSRRSAPRWPPRRRRAGAQRPRCRRFATLAAAHPGSYPLQMAIGAGAPGCRRRDAAMRATTAADALVPVTTGTRARGARGSWRPRRGDRRARRPRSNA